MFSGRLKRLQRLLITRDLVDASGKSVVGKAHIS